MSWKCKFCGKETDDYYMLNNRIWWKINLSDEEYKKMLAIHPLGTNSSSSVVEHQKNFQSAGLIYFKQLGSRKFSTTPIFM